MNPGNMQNYIGVHRVHREERKRMKFPSDRGLSNPTKEFSQVHQMTVQRKYKVRNEGDVLADVRAQKAAMTLRQVAAFYGRPITYGDVWRILQGIFPKGAGKRAALRLAPVCPACTQRLPRTEHVTPPWLDEAVGNLERLLEEKVDNELETNTSTCTCKRIGDEGDRGDQ